MCFFFIIIYKYIYIYIYIYMLYMYIYICIYVWIYIYCWWLKTDSFFHNTTFRVSCLSKIFRYLFITFLKLKYKIFENWNNTAVQVQVNYPFSADFTRTLFSCLHLRKNSDILFNKCSSLKCFKGQNFYVKHDLQTPPLRVP